MTDTQSAGTIRINKAVLRGQDDAQMLTGWAGGAASALLQSGQAAGYVWALHGLTGNVTFLTSTGRAVVFEDLVVLKHLTLEGTSLAPQVAAVSARCWLRVAAVG